MAFIGHVVLGISALALSSLGFIWVRHQFRDPAREAFEEEDGWRPTK
jgi:hypothetical protein